MNPWKPDDNPKQARRIGKTLEELGELTAVLARISIQGIDEIDPSSGKTNRQRFTDEAADVVAQLELSKEFFNFNDKDFRARVDLKKLYMRDWEAHFESDKN